MVLLYILRAMDRYDDVGLFLILRKGDRPDHTVGHFTTSVYISPILLVVYTYSLIYIYKYVNLTLLEIVTGKYRLVNWWK